MNDAYAAIRPAEVEWRDEVPISTRFRDRYFSSDGGMAESRTVFIAGNRLEERFAALPADGLFVIGETGLGSGTNLLSAAELFRRHAPKGARLALISAELHPLRPSDLKRALAPTLRFRKALIEQYPPPTPGFHRLRLDTDIDLTLMFGDALAMWTQQTAAVDAWFLDGFAPTRNPALWQRDLMAELFRRSRPGTTLATFTVARSVRDALTAVGFEIERRPGFGRKRQRLEGHRPGRWQARRYRRGHVVIAGAGLAGATTARALAERGWQITVHDPGGVAAAASGNPAGVTYTTASRSTSAQNRWYQSSYLFALRQLVLSGSERQGIARLGGIVQHVVSERQRRRFEAATDSGLWPDTLLESLTDARVRFPNAGSVQPPAWCRWLLDHPSILTQRIPLTTLQTDADAIVLCVGGETTGFAALDALPLRRVRGQVTLCRMTPASRRWSETRCHDGYCATAFDGLHCLGASFDPRSRSLAPRDADDRANLERLQRYFPAAWRDLGGDRLEITGRRVALRCQLHDYLPAVGELPGAANESTVPVMINLGHGSRGLTNTPLAAELLADRLSGLPLPVDPALVSALDPLRLWRRPSSAAGPTSPPATESR